MRSQDAIEQQYHEAVDALVEKIEKDPYILAAIVAGELLLCTGMGEIGPRCRNHRQRCHPSDAIFLLTRRKRRKHPRQYNATERI